HGKAFQSASLPVEAGIGVFDLAAAAAAALASFCFFSLNESTTPPRRSAEPGRLAKLDNSAARPRRCGRRVANAAPRVDLPVTSASISLVRAISASIPPAE